MRRTSLASAVLVVALMLFGTCEYSQAAYLHYFSCADCHKPGTTLTTLATTNTCLQCHGTVLSPKLMSDGSSPTPTGGFVLGDASNFAGSYPVSVTPDQQSSHYWATPTDVVPSVNALAPVDPKFAGKASGARITCSRCHNPHADRTTLGKKSLRLYDTTKPVTDPSNAVEVVSNAMCLDCHRRMNKSNPLDHGLESHPLVADYATTVAAANTAYLAAHPSALPADYPYKATPDNSTTAAGNVTLLNGGIACVSCHRTHFADSDASTADGPSVLPAVATGDGLMLKHNGPGKENPAVPGAGDSICQTCHQYKGHIAATMVNPLGCNVCHGGHAFDPVGNAPNYYILNKTIVIDSAKTPNPTDGPGIITINLNYTTLTSDWMNAGGTGYCQGCHALGASHNGLTTGTADIGCNGCHSHDSATFTGGGCNTCHGYSPSTDTVGGPTGFAADPDTGLNYKTAPGVTSPKNEATTAHLKHADPLDVSASNYKLSCSECHTNFATSHRNGSYQNVDFGALAATGGLIPAVYAPAGSGTCATLYCHSDGRSVRAGGPTAKVIPAWAGGATVCTSCHNTGTTGTNVVHNTHLALTGLSVSCDTCHTLTSANGSTLKATATGTGGVHVDGTVTVDGAFNTFTPAAFNAPDGKCAVYCHTNGSTYAVQPDWDDTTTGDCGDCHAITAGVPVANGGLSATHDTHLALAGVTCTTCHTHNGLTFGGVSGHINGSPDAEVTPGVCNTCHGATLGQAVGFDREPVWTDPTSVECATCHVGVVSVIGGRSPSSKAYTYTSGHNFPGPGAYPDGVPAANKTCTTCHDANGAGHLNGSAGDMRLNTGFSCTTCHTTKLAHRNKDCFACHDPHGTSNWGMVHDSQAKQNLYDTSLTDKFSGNVVFLGRTGVDSYEENDGVTNGDDICATCHATTTHNNRAGTGVHFDGLTHSGEDCFTCHNGHEVNPPFSGNANTCEGCHSNLATKGAHAVHMNVTPDIVTDRSECVLCHVGADTYITDAGGLHRNGSINVNVAIGYDGGTGACATACHKSSVGDGFWNDTALDCTACHYYAANPTLLTNDADADKLTGDHSKHFGLGSVVTCADCHTVPVAGDTAHISNVTGADQGAVLTGKANALQNEAAVTATLLVSGTEDDTVPGNETCNNTACHNPSGLAKSAQWNISIADCTLCHSNTDPTTGSHTKHMGAATLFGINTIACTSCHVDNGTNNAHRNGTVTFAAGMGYTAGAEVLGLATVGTCTTTTCHNNGTVAATAVPTPTWGVTPGDACAICHGNAPATAKHAAHVGNTAYVAARCNACHTAATATTHINSSRNMLVTVPYVSGTQTCTNSCHLADTSGDWTLAGTLACLDCHAGTYVGGNNVAKGFNAIPATGLHAGTLTTSANTHDDSFKATRNEVTASAGCATCHTATPSSNHIDGTFTTSWNAVAPSINFAAAVQFVDNATAPTCGPNAGLVGCHDDDGAWKRKWSLTAKNSNGTECANCHGTYDLSFVTGMAGRHQTTTSGDVGGQIAASHDGTDKCYTCHAFKAGDTTFYNFATKHRDGAIQINSNVTLQPATVTGVGCTSCHSGSDGTADGQHMFQDVIVGNSVGFERWTLEQITGPSADCNSCHTLNGRTHAGATENATLHDLHIANQYNVAGCVQCHSNAGPGNADHNNGTVNFGGTYMSASVSYGPAPGTVDFGGTCAGVGVNGCHNAPDVGAQDWAAWTAVTSSIVCADCHNAPTKLLNQGAWPPATNLHGQHLGDAYLTTEQCSECHGANAKDGKHVGHKDTGADFGGALTSYTALDGTCANTCHYVVNGRDWTSATALQCADCHNADVLTGSADGTMRLDQNGYPPTSGEHTPHLGNNALVPGDCADCHGANAVTGAHTGHLNQAKTVANQVTSYDSVDPGAGTCINLCHAVVDGRDWTSATTLICADCHNADGNPADLGTFTLDQGNYPPSSAKHGEHLASNVYVLNDCTDCHGANATAGTHANHKNGAVDDILTYASATQTCTNSCHVAGTTGDWTTGGALACLDCHAGSYIGGNNVAKGFNATPTTGLHTGTLTTTNNTHDDSFNDGVSATAGTCASCHTATPSTNHMDGTYTSSYNAVAPSINFAATVGFADAATPTCGPNGAQVACHDDGGAWKRKWSVSAKLSNGTECANCHGDFSNGFVTGMALRHQVAGASDVDGQVASSHDTCNTCHTFKSGDATYYTWATQHRDGSIQLNNGMGFTDAGALVGCSGCHVANDGTADEGHQFEDTENTDALGFNRWTRTLQAGPAADCAGCHDSILATAHASVGESLTTHNLHTTSLYYDDVTAKCTMCHENNGSGALHNNGTVNFANNMSNTLNYPRTGYAANCAIANGCHSSDNGEWVAGNLGLVGNACADCHVKTGTLFTTITSTAYPPSTGAHAVHNANTSFVGLNDCSECHGVNANLGTHAAHKDKTLNNTVTYASASGTCTNNCHVVVDGRDWTSATALACADCHNAGVKTLSQGAWPPVSNKHTQHVGTAPNAAYGDTVNHATAGAYEFGCGSCHGTTATNHANGAKDISLANWGGAVTKTCGQNSCHQNGAGAAPAQATVDWDAVPGYTGTDVCAICHLNSPSTAAHGVHVQGIHSKDIYTGTTGLALPGLGATASHGSEAYSTTLNCNTCHYATVTANFNDKNTYCVTCHTVSAPAKGTMTVNVKSAHVNGAVNVQFRNVQVKSKAQLRDNLADASLTSVWTRTVGYKASGAYDLANASLTAGTFAGNSCSNISCHNNKAATWQTPANDCLSCHTSLPR